MNNCIGLLVPKIERTTQKRFSTIRSTGNPYLTLSFIAKEFFMAQLVV